MQVYPFLQEFGIIITLNPKLGFLHSIKAMVVNPSLHKILLKQHLYVILASFIEAALVYNSKLAESYW